MRFLKTLGAAAAIAAMTAAAPASAKPDQLTVYGGPLNTSWYVIAGWLATELNKAGVKSNSELGGALTNIMKVVETPVNMGFTFAASTGMANAGTAPFPRPMNEFCAIQINQASMFHALVSQSSGVMSAEDLKGKAFSGQAVGNLSQLALAHFLEASGVAASDIDLAIGGQQFGANGVKDRRFVGFAAMTSPPSPPMMDAATSVPVRFLPIDDALFEKIQGLNSGYARTVMPAGSYPNQDEDVPTFGTVAFTMMNSTSAEDDQYFVTKLMHTNWDGLKAAHSSTRFLTPEKATAVPGTELCPGAAKYWAEVGGI